MLQRQHMLKQLQELQRRQQLLELGDARNQDYANQRMLLMQTSGIQFSPAVNGAPIHDSQMIQPGGSSIFQGSLNGLVISQSHNHALGSMGFPLPQHDISLYENAAPNMNGSLNVFSNLQGPSDLSANLFSKNGHNALRISSMNPSAFDSSFMSLQGNFSSEHIGMTDDSLLPNQVFQDKNLYGPVPLHNLNRNLSSVNCSQQGVSSHKSTAVLESEMSYEETGAHGVPSREVSKASQHVDSLDPLEQKILHNTDDNWTSSNGSKKMGTFESTMEKASNMDALSSIQSGSWSALMQSAVAETSSSDTGIQEEWSGLSFQNPDPSAGNQPLNFINSEIPQNNWADRNMQSVSSPSSDPEPKSPMNYNLSGLQKHHYLKQKDELRSDSPRNTSQLVQKPSPSVNIFTAQDNESRGPVRLRGRTSSSVSGGIQKSFDQMSQMNVQRYSVELEKMTSGDNVEHMTAFLGASTDTHGENLIATSESMLDLLEKDETSHDHASVVQLNSKASSLSKLPLNEASAASFANQCDNSPDSQNFGFRSGNVNSGTQSYPFPPFWQTDSLREASLSCDYVNHYIKRQYQAPPVSNQLATKFPAYATASFKDNFQQECTDSGCPEFSLLEKMSAIQSSRSSDLLQSSMFPSGPSTPFPDTIARGNALPSSSYNFSSNLFQSPDSASSNLDSSGSPKEHPNQNYFKHEQNMQEFGTFSGTSRYCEQQMEKASHFYEGLPERHIPSSASGSIHVVESLTKHQSGADGIASGSLMTFPLHSCNLAEKNDEIPAIPPGGTHLKCDSSDYQHSVANARELMVSTQKSIIENKAEYDLGAVQFGQSTGNNKGLNFLGQAQDELPGEAVSVSLQDFCQMERNQSGTKNLSIGSSDTSSLVNKSQINLQMAPSWFKHCGSLRDGISLPTYNPKAAINIAPPFPGFSVGSVQGHNLMQVNSVNPTQGSGSWPSTAAALMASKNLSQPSMLPSDVTIKNLAASQPKKRKIVALDMVPWHREVNSEAARFQSFSMAELEWAQVSNRRQDETKTDCEIVEDVPPMIRAKRRLIFTTQLIQQVFRPAPAVVISSDASSSHDAVAYFTARLALVDACKLTHKLPPSTEDVALDKLKTSNGRSTHDFSKVVEGLINQVKTLEGNISRLVGNLSIVDIRVDAQDLEKFSTINRFAKFHLGTRPGSVDPTSSLGRSAGQATNLQRYVIGRPMPQTLPEGLECLSL